MENCNKAQHTFRPYKNLDSFFNQGLNHFWSNDSITDTPSFNIQSHEDNYIIELIAPGLNKSDFNISVADNTLTISVDHKDVDNTTVDTNGKYLKREFSFSKFAKKFQLDKTILSDNIEASYENGILSIVLQKNKAAQLVKQIEIV